MRREDVLREQRRQVGRAQARGQELAQDVAVVDGHGEVALVELGGRQPRPVREHLPAVDARPHDQHDAEAKAASILAHRPAPSTTMLSSKTAFDGQSRALA